MSGSHTSLQHADPHGRTQTTDRLPPFVSTVAWVVVKSDSSIVLPPTTNGGNQPAPPVSNGFFAWLPLPFVSPYKSTSIKTGQFHYFVNFTPTAPPFAWINCSLHSLNCFAYRKFRSKSCFRGPREFGGKSSFIHSRRARKPKNSFLAPRDKGLPALPLLCSRNVTVVIMVATKISQIKPM